MPEPYGYRQTTFTFAEQLKTSLFASPGHVLVLLTCVLHLFAFVGYLITLIGEAIAQIGYYYHFLPILHYVSCGLCKLAGICCCSGSVWWSSLKFPESCKTIRNIAKDLIEHCFMFQIIRPNGGTCVSETHRPWASKPWA